MSGESRGGERELRSRVPRRARSARPDEATRTPEAGPEPVDQRVLDATVPASATQTAALQRAIGNGATGRLLARKTAVGGGRVQRHTPGASLLGGLAKVGSAEGAAEARPMPAPGEAVTAPAGAVPAAAPAAAGPDAAAAPVVLTMPTLQSAFAQTALQTSFGGLAPKPIIPGNITVVANSAALYAVYDKWMIDNNRTNSTTGVAWVAGDLARQDALGGFRTNAFAEPAPSTNIFIDATQTDPTATVHEMLHVNTSAAFVSAVGRAVDEGITQRLATEAVASTGNSLAGSESTYQSEQNVVTALIGVVGEGVVKQAYFQGSTILTETYDAMMGEDSWALLKTTLNPDTAAGYAAAIAMLVPPSVTQKIASINTIIDGWWVSGNDLDIIGRIVASCGDAEKAQIWAAISPRVSDLWFESKRDRLRAILGTGGYPAGADPVPGDDTQMA